MEALAGAAPGVVRSFPVPEINTAVREYTELVFWERSVTPLAVLNDMDDEHPEAAAAAGPLALPCHTQAVERYVHEVT